MEKNEFLNIVKKYEPKKHAFFHSAMAFLCGALLGLLAQGEYDLLTKVAGLEVKMSLTLVSLSFIALSVGLTIFGVYKNLGQFFGAGLFIPITGFANSMASAAIEYRSEGPIFGIGSKIFSLAGSVIIYGIIGSFLYAVIILILHSCGVTISW